MCVPSAQRTPASDCADTRRLTVSDRDQVKSTWSSGGGALTQLVNVTMRPAKPRPCNTQCPWLVANHGRTVRLFYDHEVPGVAMPEGEFTFAPWKRARVWADDLRDGVDGYGSLCHVRLPGTRLGPGNMADVVARQCSGALVMQQREVLRRVQGGECALTPAGAARVAGEMLGREVAEHELTDLDVRELLEHAHPSLLDPKIGSDAVAPPLSEREMVEWGRLRAGPAR
jgi:hypothetical protein